MKRKHKLGTFIITIIILSAAFFVTALYPRTGVAMDILRDKYKKISVEEVSSPKFYIKSSMVNYAVEATYFIHGLMLQEYEKKEVDFTILEKYGWDHDYSKTVSDMSYLVVYEPKEGETYTKYNSYINLKEHNIISIMQDMLENNLNEETKDILLKEGILAYFVSEYDPYGKLIVADMKYLSEDIIYPGNDAYQTAKSSIEQYANNVEHYYESDNKDPYWKVLPNNFKAVFLVAEDSYFVNESFQNTHMYIDGLDLFLETRVLYFIAGIALLVAFFALFLPAVKCLHTGWERIFSLHIELLICMGIAFVGVAIFMCEAMAYTNTYEIHQYIENSGAPEILGYSLDEHTIYQILLVINYIGWAILFWFEYILVASFRQLLVKPVYYLKNRFLIVCILKWLLAPFKKLYRYITDIDLKDNLKKSILKITIIHFVVVSILCCLWFAGNIGALICSIILYILLTKYLGKMQKQYDCILQATDQMATGDLKISLNEDLGIFEPIGNSLEKIQSGFATALAEEAKSQQMKTELITNVSHDLKTPLTAIITYVDLLKDPNLSEEDRESYIETLEQKTQRLKILIDDLFQVSKAQSGNITMDYMDIDVINLMKQVRLEMEDQIADSNLQFRWNLPDEKVVLRLDGQKTYRIFSNLINNIIKYSMPNSRVFIDINNECDKVLICFRNISQAELDFDVERLTDRFVRGDKSRNTEGSGLGLAIAKSFVELQNGTFKIDVDGDLFKVMIIWNKTIIDTE